MILRDTIYQVEKLLKTYRLSELNFFVYIKSCQYSMFYTKKKCSEQETRFKKYVIRPKTKLHVFPLTLPTLIFCAYPKVFLAIFEQSLLKSECVPCRN